VAITKIDKPNANIERAKQSLTENEVYLEGLGGNVPWVPISSKTGAGIDELMDMVLLAAELEELSGDPMINAAGVVIESHIDPKKGISATLIIKNGTLKKGMFVVAEDSWSPVRVIETHTGSKSDTASLSEPVAITGFNKVPAVGTIFTSFERKKDAEAAVLSFGEKSGSAQISREETPGDAIIIPLIVKADAIGTLEAVLGEINRIKIEYIHFKILHSGAGDISENDLKVAGSAESPIVIGFNVKVDKRAEQIIDRINATLKTFDIIYKLTEWLAEESKTRIPKEMKHVMQGRAEILRVFSSSKGKSIIGGKVVEGVLMNKGAFKIIRRGNEIGQGKIAELQQKKSPAEEVSSGKEFGAMVESKIDIAEGDTLESFTVSE